MATQCQTMSQQALDVLGEYLFPRIKTLHRQHPSLAFLSLNINLTSHACLKSILFSGLYLQIDLLYSFLPLQSKLML
jgi:hypothetical protein